MKQPGIINAGFFAGRLQPVVIGEIGFMRRYLSLSGNKTGIMSVIPNTE